MRRTDLSPARQQFLQTCHDLGFGFIRNLRVVKSEPLAHPPPASYADIVFGKQNGPDQRDFR